jgi:hypothetical protein
VGLVRFSLLVGVASVCLPASMAASIGFHPRVDLSTGSSKPVRIAIADFNGDGKLDIAAPDYYGHDLLIYLNKGDGTFGAPIVNTLQITNTLDGLVASDVDKDGKQDLVVGTVSGAQQDDIVLLGNDDGTFRQQPPIPGSFGFFDAKLADFNGDGNLDLITAANVPLYFFAGHGDGSFAAPQTLSSSNGFFSEMVVGDFNGDKKLDFVGVNPGASGISGVGFFAGDGNGGFTEQFYPLQTFLNSPNSIDAADFNGDGKLDLVLAAPDVTVVAFGNGDGTFQLAENQLVLGWGPSLPPTFTGYDFQVVRAADMDGDGKPDVVAIDNYTGQMAVVLNDGNGGLGEAQTFTVAQGLDDLRVADLNGDGLPDVVVVNPTTQTISVFLSIKPLISSPIAVSVGANQQLVGSNVSITTKVATSGSVAPTGSITLLDGSAVLGKQTLDNTGLATFTMDTPTLTDGRRFVHPRLE